MELRVAVSVFSGSGFIFVGVGPSLDGLRIPWLAAPITLGFSALPTPPPSPYPESASNQHLPFGEWPEVWGLGLGVEGLGFKAPCNDTNII